VRAADAGQSQARAADAAARPRAGPRITSIIEDVRIWYDREGANPAVELREIAAVFGIPANRHTVFLLGGQFSADNAETLGPMTIRQVQDFHADYGLISPAAIDSATGMTGADLAEASVARTMIGPAERLVFTVDHSRFEKRAAHLVSLPDAIDVLVCDPRPEGLSSDGFTKAV
jgi:hypothetical protein